MQKLAAELVLECVLIILPYNVKSLCCLALKTTETMNYLYLALCVIR